jgi:hypothetical protein
MASKRTAPQQTTPGAIISESATHYTVRVIASTGNAYTAKWAKDSGPAPTSQEIRLAWDEDTGGGRWASDNWRRV